jgi:Na+/H+-dicarboxylate symporter
MNLLTSMWRNGTTRGALIVLAMVLSMRGFPVTAPKVLGAGILLLFAINLFRELKTYVRPTRTLYAICRIRTQRFLKRVKGCPPMYRFYTASC